MGIYVSVLYLGTLMSPLVGAFIFEGMGSYHAVFVSASINAELASSSTVLLDLD